MTRRIRQFTVAGFALWLVALSGIVYPQVTAHMGQHDHHGAATHATALCSWLCIAGDAVDGTVTVAEPVRYATLLNYPSPVNQPLHFHGSQTPSRAPPLL
jgi:hypothetical protein